jgi:hypothetical protein
MTVTPSVTAVDAVSLSVTTWRTFGVAPTFAFAPTVTASTEHSTAVTTDTASSLVRRLRETFLSLSMLFSSCSSGC